MKFCRHCGMEKPDETFAIAAVVKGKVYRRQQCNTCKKTREARRTATIEAWGKGLNKKTHPCARCGFSDFRAWLFIIAPGRRRSSTSHR